MFLIISSVSSVTLVQFSTKTAEADTSSELAKKSKETFRKEVGLLLCFSLYYSKPLVATHAVLYLFEYILLFQTRFFPLLSVCVRYSDVPVHSAMSKSFSETRLQTWTHQQHGRLQTPGEEGKIQQFCVLHVLPGLPSTQRRCKPFVGLFGVGAQ